MASREPRPGEIAELRMRIDALAIRKRLGRQEWDVPLPWGEGWKFNGTDGRLMIVTYWPSDMDPEYDYGGDWLHASIGCRGATPTYDDLKLMHRAVFDGGYAYQCFVPTDKHINIAEALHLWGRADGSPALPDFGRFGSI